MEPGGLPDAVAHGCPRALAREVVPAVEHIEEGQVPRPSIGEVASRPLQRLWPSMSLPGLKMSAGTGTGTGAVSPPMSFHYPGDGLVAGRSSIRTECAPALAVITRELVRALGTVNASSCDTGLDWNGLGRIP